MFMFGHSIGLFITSRGEALEDAGSGLSWEERGSGV